MNKNDHKLDPKLDLVLERIVEVPKELVWKAWTTPDIIKQWYTPVPWKTVECELDLRPGGMFRTVMQSPEGENFPNMGCYLEVIPNEKLVWTDEFNVIHYSLHTSGNSRDRHKVYRNCSSQQRGRSDQT